MNVADLKGMKWPELVTMMDQQFMLVVSSPDLALREAAVLTKNHGKKAGAAYVATAMLAQENPKLAISEAVRLYEELAVKHNIEELRFQVDEMAGWTAWAGMPFPKHTRKKNVWPIQIPKRELLNNGGYLNFLLVEGLKRYEPCTTSDHVAVDGAWRFIDWMLKLDGGLRSLKRRAA